METKLNLDNPSQLTLTDDVQEKIVKFVSERRTKAVEAWDPYRQKYKETDRLYKCEPKPLEGDDVDWQTNYVLPWAYDAVESAYSHLCNTMLPRDEQIFEATGRTQEDHAGVKVMAQYLEHRLADSGALEQLKKGLKQDLIRNHTCYKVYWRTDKRVSHEYVVDELTGQKRKEPQEIKVFDNVWTDVVDIDDVWFYPIHGRIEDVTFAHCTYRFKEELEAEANDPAAKVPYFNLDKIKSKEDSEHEEKKKTLEGLKLEEVWIPRIKIDDKVYTNYVATLVNEKVLIRFQPNPYEMGKIPFLWHCANPDGVDCLLGEGLLSKGVGLLNQASFLLNQKLNEIKLNLYGAHKYYDDGVFNPYNIISRPGAMIKMASPESVSANLQPLSVNPGMLAQAMSEIMELKAEFESVTVPKVVKGMLEVTNRTATEIQGAQNNGSTKLHVFASSFNDAILKRKLELDYLMIYQKTGDRDVLLDIARLTQESTKLIEANDLGQPLPEPIPVQKTDDEFLAEIPEILPLPKIDIKIVGYENQTRKQEKLAAIAQAIPQLSNSPGGQYLKWYNLSEDVLRLLDLDYDNLLMDRKEAEAADASAAQKADQQQQLMMAEMQNKAELERFKEEHRAEMDRLEMQLKAMDMQLKYQAEENKNLQTVYQEATGEPTNVLQE